MTDRKKPLFRQPASGVFRRRATKFADDEAAERALAVPKEEYPVTAGPAWQPAHPGEILREDILPALGIGVPEAAERMRVSRQMLHRIVAGESAVTPAMALRLGRFVGGDPRFWLNLQQAHDLWRAEREMAKELAQITVAAR